MFPRHAPALPALIEALDLEDVQWYAVQAQGAIGPPAAAAIPRLEGIASTTDKYYLRRDAEEALGRIRGKTGD